MTRVSRPEFSWPALLRGHETVTGPTVGLNMPDVIEKTITVKAPIEQVWRALTDYREFGTWFRVDLNEPFVLGRITTGKPMRSVMSSASRAERAMPFSGCSKPSRCSSNWKQLLPALSRKAERCRINSQPNISIR